MGRIAIYRLLRMGGGPHYSCPWKRLEDTRRAPREPSGALGNGCLLRACGSREQSRATHGPRRHSVHPIAGASGLTATVASTNGGNRRSNAPNCYMHPILKREVCGGDFETVIQRSKWGMSWGLNFGVPDNIKLLVQVEAVKQ